MLPANKVDNGYIRCGLDDGSYVPELPFKSLYLQMVKSFNENLREGDWVWLRNFMTNENYMASEFQKNAQKFAKILKDLGLGEDDKIHVCVGNHNYSFSLLGGAWILGAVVSCGDVALDASAISNQLIDLQAKVALCTSDTRDNVMQAVETARSKLGQDIKIISFGPVKGALDVIAMLEETHISESPDPVEFSEDDLKEKEVAIFWTSGTTGAPKGICHTHFSAWNLDGWRSQILTRNTNIVTSSCFFQIGGFFTSTNACRKRQTCFHMFGSGLNVSCILNAIKESKCTTILLGAHHFVQLAESEVLKTADTKDFDNIEELIPAGAAVPSYCEISFRAKFQNMKQVSNLYGMSEVGIVTISETTTKLGSVIPGHIIKISDHNTGKTLGPNQTGEIRVKNDTTMRRYLNRKEATEEFFDSEGFACTGDLGYYDDSGDLHYFDRMKELIKYKSSHVSPTEIEGILQELPGVQESLVFGYEQPDEQKELISAVVVVNPGKTLTEEEVKDHINNKVADFKKIRGPVLFRDQIPRNSVGKLVRREMRAWAQNQAKDFISKKI